MLETVEKLRSSFEVSYDDIDEFIRLYTYVPFVSIELELVTIQCY